MFGIASALRSSQRRPFKSGIAMASEAAVPAFLIDGFDRNRTGDIIRKNREWLVIKVFESDDPREGIFLYKPFPFPATTAITVEVPQK
jgi:hypothetical protein